MKKTTVIGLLGPVLDFAKGAKRWNSWRPTVAICQQEDLLIDRFDILYPVKYKKLLDTIVDDIGYISPETNVQTHEINFEDPWDFEEVYAGLHDFAKSYKFNQENQDYLIHITTGTHVAQICLYLLTESNYLPAKLIQTSPTGARKGSLKIQGEYAIIDLDLSRYDRIAMRFQQEIKEDLNLLKSGIDTKNKKFNRLIEEIEHVCINSNEPTLIYGPTGAGKSHLARRIYELKQRHNKVNGKFVEINCATLRGDSAMSSLFGHKKGAFTGALTDREGSLKRADKGLLFLDEIGELGLDEQSMLLKAVEEKKFLPMGCDNETKSDFQLICGTNKDLKKEIKKGKFREDLFSRINLWSFKLPGLCERPEDIEPNLKYELDRYAKKK